MFTDNILVKCACHKGSGPWKELFDLVLHLCKLQMDKLFLHVIHIPGKQMCDQATEGLSIGQLNEGVMHHGTLLQQVPLHFSAFNWQLSVWPGVISFFADHPANLTPMEWYTLGHTNGTFVWAPPPVAADATLEQLAAATHKHPYNTHLVIIPHLMTETGANCLIKSVILCSLCL